MTRYPARVFCFLAVAAALALQGSPPQSTGTPLIKLMPAGPLLYVEAPDFAALLHDWNDSQEKKAWLESDNYQVFSRSRLFLRLQEVQEQFAAAAGVPIEMPLLESVAGSESGLAIYDIGNLEFLYITRLPEARALDNTLWRAKEKFEPRKVADIPYYVHTEPSKNRLVAFAVARGYLLVTTREDLIAGALSALSGKPMRELADEAWFAKAIAAAGPRGDLRLALNLETLVKSPYFRSYWIQRNVSELRQYHAEVADLFRSPHEIREERVLLRDPAGTPSVETATPEKSALPDLLRLVPDQAGVYRAWNDPSVEQALALLQQKVLSPQTRAVVPTTIAPAVALSEGQTGSEGDLETHIDVPPFAGASATFEPAALKKLLAEANLAGALQLGSTRALPGEVLDGTESAVVLEAATDWNAEALRAALLPAVEGLWTTSGLGAQWVEQGAGETAHSELDGLTHLALAVRGRLLVVGTGGGPVIAVLERLSKAPGKEGGTYAAGFRHAAERGEIVKLTRLIEAPLGQPLGRTQEPGGHEPWFFSENLASLSSSLARVESESIVVHDSGPLVRQTVTYRLGK
jgi:hypothetical protein